MKTIEFEHAHTTYGARLVSGEYEFEYEIREDDDGEMVMVDECSDWSNFEEGLAEYEQERRDERRHGLAMRRGGYDY